MGSAAGTDRAALTALGPRGSATWCLGHRATAMIPSGARTGQAGEEGWNEVRSGVGGTACPHAGLLNDQFGSGSWDGYLNALEPPLRY